MKKAQQSLLKGVMSQGGKIDLSIFSSMDPNIFMKEIIDL